MAWLDDWGDEIAIDDLQHPAAKAVAAYLPSAVDIATLVAVRRNASGMEILIVDLQTGAPQRPAVAIESVEPIGIAFVRERAMPLILALRSDFPDTEHQQLMAEGCPAALCIDDRPWDEARLTWTPAEMLQRLAAWFRRAARGELHDAHQPLDPIFEGSVWKFVFPRSVLSNRATSVELAAFVNEAEDPTIIHVAPVAALRAPFVGTRLLPLAYGVRPERMTRMRKAPRHLSALAKFLLDRDVDLLSDLRTRIRRWSGTTQEDGHRLSSKLAVVVEMPVVRPGGDLTGAFDIRTFVTETCVGEIGVALGLLHKTGPSVAASCYVRAVPEAAEDDAALAAMQIDIAQVHIAFDADRAAELAGRERADPRRAVLVGAGAIGSHVAEFLVREGRFVWTLIDDDRLLPHNLARHTLQESAVGRRKARALQERLNAIFSPLVPKVATDALPCNVLHPGEHGEQLTAALREADLVIDATASIAASRRLSDEDGDARRASAFFNPSGEAAVILVEAADRSVSLRDLEAQYYRAILRRPELEHHLSAIGDRFAYTGACRAVTNRLPESRVALLSALAADGLGKAFDGDGATLRVWSVDRDGRVEVSAPDIAAVERQRVGDWEVTVDLAFKDDLIARRAQRLPNETGGCVLGIVDAQARKIHIVDALPAPPDSVETVRVFERGVAGLTEMVAAQMRRAMDQIRYIGEWHSHPPHASTAPSSLDLAQLAWTSAVLAAEESPALSLIVGDCTLTILVGSAGVPVSSLCSEL